MARKPHKKSQAQGDQTVSQDEFTPSEDALIGDTSSGNDSGAGYIMGVINVDTGDIGSDEDEQLNAVDVNQYEELSEEAGDRTRKKLESSTSTEEDDGVNTADDDQFLDKMYYERDEWPADYE